MPSVLTDANKKAILRLWLDGKQTTQEIAEKYGVSTTTIMTILRTFDAPRRKRGRKVREVSINQIKALFQQGRSQVEIASLLETTPNVIRRYEKQWGLVRTKGGPHALSAEERTKIIPQLYLSGRTIEEIALQFHKIPNSIRLILKKAGVWKKKP
jgi:transposase-like protein